MGNIFERNYFLRTSDFDRYRRIRLSSIMDLFQDAAGLHAKQLGCGFDELIAKDMMWVIVRIKLSVVSWPKMFSEVCVRTWPLEPTRAGFRREYIMTDTEGRELVRGSSDWVIMHSQERKLIPIKDIYNMNDGFCKEEMHPGRLVRLRDVDEASKVVEIKPAFSDIDMNGHVNNIKYIDYVVNCISPQSPMDYSSIQIDFRKEILPEDTIEINMQETGDTIYSKGVDKEGNTLFVCNIE